MNTAKAMKLVWTEPEPGKASKPFNLSPDEWATVELAVAEVKAYWDAAEPGAYGTTVVSISFSPARMERPSKLQVALEFLAEQSRYTTGEDLYTIDIPVFAAAGIERN